MKDFRLGKNALFFSILTLITVLTWIGVEVYLTATKTTIPKVTQEQMAPLDPRIKEEVIENLKANFWLSEEEISNFNFPSSTESAQGR
jgi:hypothetical protein